MNGRTAAAWLGAAAIHLYLLFGFRWRDFTPASVALPDATAVEVSLVEAPAEEAAAAEAPPAPAPTPAEPVPRPAIAEPSAPPPPAPEATPSPAETPDLSRLSQKVIAAPRHLTRLRRAPAAQTLAARGSSLGAPHAGGETGGATTAARYRSNPRPEYPEEAKQLRQQGLVLLSVQVSAEGRAESVKVIRGSGFPLLDRAATEGVRRWIFDPAREGGIPVASRAEVPVRFSLRNP